MPIRVTDYISTTHPDDTYSTHLASLGHGGFRSVDTVAQMNEITQERREFGMLVFVAETNTVYILEEDLNTWSAFINQTEGEPYVYIMATDNLSAGDFVNIYTVEFTDINGNNIKIARARKANAQTKRAAWGYVNESASIGNIVQVFLRGRNNFVTGLLPGSEYYLSATEPGKVSVSKPEDVTALVQQIGIATSESSIEFHYFVVPEDVIYHNEQGVPADIGGIVAGENFINMPMKDLITKLLYPEDGRGSASTPYAHIEASEFIPEGAFVNIFDHTYEVEEETIVPIDPEDPESETEIQIKLVEKTESRVRLSTASEKGKEAWGFVRESVALGDIAKVYFDGINDKLTGLIPGKVYYLAEENPGSIVDHTPLDVTAITQQIGVALDETNLEFHYFVVPEDVIYHNLNPTPIAVGGIRKGESFENMPMKDLITKLLYPEDGRGSGVNGAVFITNVTPQDPLENVGNKVYAADNKSLTNALSTTPNVKVHILALTGHTKYRPDVNVNGVPVTLTENSDAPLWTGVVDVTFGSDGKLVASHEDGPFWETDIEYDAPPTILDAYFSTPYPGTQTELKENDVMGITVEADMPIVAYEISNSGAFKAANGTFAETSTPVITNRQIANRGVNTTTQGFRIRVQKATGAWSTWFDTSEASNEELKHVVKLNNRFPTITFGTIVYPSGQTALKGSEQATVNHTVIDFDTISYTSSQLNIPEPSEFVAAKVVSRSSGTYNISTNNFNISANRAANNATRTGGIVVSISDAVPVINISVPHARLRSGGNNGTSAQTYTVTLTSNQRLETAPLLNAPEGTWVDATFTPNGARTSWTRRIRIHDNDAKGTFNFNSLVVKSLSGQDQTTINSGETYVLGGFVFRTLRVNAFPNRETDIGTHVSNTGKLRCTNLSKGGSGSLNFTYQSDLTNTPDRYTITGPSGVHNPEGNIWHNLDGANASSNTGGEMFIELEEVI